MSCQATSTPRKISCLFRTMRRIFHSPFFIRLISHCEFQCPTFIEFIPVQPALFQWFAIQRSRLYIICIRGITCRFNHKRFSSCIHRTKFNFNLIKQWTAHLESRPFTSSSLYIEQSHCRHHIPGSQLSLIFILTVAITMLSVCSVKLITNQARPFLR